jgi:hypothetical protein
MLVWNKTKYMQKLKHLDQLHSLQLQKGSTRTRHLDILRQFKMLAYSFQRVNALVLASLPIIASLQKRATIIYDKEEGTGKSRGPWSTQQPWIVAMLDTNVMAYGLQSKAPQTNPAVTLQQLMLSSLPIPLSRFRFEKRLLFWTRKGVNVNIKHA